MASPGHLDAAPAEVTFGPVAHLAAGPDPVYDYTGHSCSKVYCHEPFGQVQLMDPAWAGTLAGARCGSCHEDPPASHAGVSADACARCHATSIAGGGAARTFVDPGTHASGTREGRMSCTACHGDAARLPEGEQLTDAAPPLDAQALGSSAEVGTHQSHLFGRATSPLSDGVACSACHAVPTGFAHVNGVAAVALKMPTGTASGPYSRPGAGPGRAPRRTATGTSPAERRGIRRPGPLRAPRARATGATGTHQLRASTRPSSRITAGWARGASSVTSPLGRPARSRWAGARFT
jgi:predicted CxxxxCH...CXXCH cytochrome family protein